MKRSSDCCWNGLAVSEVVFTFAVEDVAVAVEVAAGRAVQTLGEC